MSDDIYEDLRQIYAKLQMNSPAESTIGETQLDFPAILSEEQPEENANLRRLYYSATGRSRYHQDG